MTREILLLLSYVAVTAAIASANAEEAAHLLNGGFEQPADAGNIAGWEIRANGHKVSVTEENPATGARSLRIQSASAPRGTLVRQSIPVAVLQRGPLQLHGRLRTDEVSGSAVMFVVVDGEQGRLFVDDMRDRPVRGTTGWTHYTIAIPQLDAAKRAYAGVLLLGAGTAWADDFRLVAQDNGERMSAEASAYLDNAIDIMARRHVNRAAIDWNALREFAHRAASGAQTPRDTWPAIAAAVTRLEDGHSRFAGPAGNAANAPVAAEVPEIRIHHEMLDMNIGYIEVPSVHVASGSRAATAYVERMHAALETLTDGGACGWIVDLRENTGGTMWPMLAGIGPLAGEGVLGAHVIPGGERSEWWYRDGRAGIRTGKGERVRSAASEEVRSVRREGQAVAVLLSGNTASAGEAVAIAFEGLEDARSFGSPTSGLTTANVEVPIGQGARIILAIAYSADRTGKTYSGSVTPDHHAAPGAVLDGARRWLASSTACRMR